MPASKPRLEIIEWLDANSGVIAQEADDLPGPSRIVSVGFVLREDDRTLWFASEQVDAPGDASETKVGSLNLEWRNWTVLPKSLITRRRALTERKRA
jgi:hypothetical protein